MYQCEGANRRSWKVIVHPTSEPIAVDDPLLLFHCKLEADDVAESEEEPNPVRAYVAQAVRAGRRVAEKHQGTAIMPQTIRINYDYFPSVIELVKTPFIQMNVIKCVRPNGSVLELEPEDYLVDDTSRLARVVPAYGTSWPSTRPQINAVTIEYQVGYNYSEEDVSTPETPPDTLQAIMLLAAHFYEYGLPVLTGTIATKIPFNVEYLLDVDRVI